MDRTIDRRRALASIGTLGLGAVLAACGSSRDGGGDTAASTTGATPTSTTGASSGDAATTTGGGSGDAATATTTADGDAVATVDAARFDQATACSLTPELTEGPYYFDVDSIRSDIREGREGSRLRLGIRVRDAATCTPVPDAVEDIWHCDATGLYSGFEAASTGSGGGRASGPTDSETYLRGAQVTNADGIVEFVTIYPGWYRGRTVHIHTKVHLQATTVLTSQLFFDEAFTEAVYRQEPYASDAGRDTSNDDDGIFDPALLLTLTQDGDGSLGLITLDVAA